MNKEEFIAYWTEKLKPWADIQLILSDPSSIDDDQKNDISKLISPIFYSTKELLILFLQLTQGFLINDHDDFDFYFSILEFLIPKIKEFLTSNEIYSIYHKTFNHILLWYYEHDLLNIETIITVSKNDTELFQYFIKEIKEHDEVAYESIFNKYNEVCQFTIAPNFEEKRKSRMNDSLIAKVIQEDNIYDFQNIISSTNLDINSEIPYSIFESCVAVNYSNDMPTLIEFASFFGSIKIFKFLLMQNARISSNIWDYAIHGNNYDIIHLLEDHHVKYLYCVQGAIRYYRYDLFEYFTETQSIEITRDCINRAILNFNLPILIDSNILSSLYDNPNLTSTDEGDWNPLICSSLKSYPIITELLLSIPNINPNVVYKNEFSSPLIISVRNSCFENVKLLCEYKLTNINSIVFNRNALCMAAGVGDVKILQFFLNFSNEMKNSDDLSLKRLKVLNLNFDHLMNPFNWAISNNHLQIVQILYTNPLIKQKMNEKETEIHVNIVITTIVYHFWECFEFLIQSEPQENFDVFSKLLSKRITELKELPESQHAKELFEKEIKRRSE